MDVMLIVFCMAATLLAAALTVPAGFGLATMLTPVMLLWLDPHLAIAAVAVVHAAHNGWKLVLLKTDVDFGGQTLWLGNGPWCIDRCFT